MLKETPAGLPFQASSSCSSCVFCGFQCEELFLIHLGASPNDYGISIAKNLTVKSVRNHTKGIKKDDGVLKLNGAHLCTLNDVGDAIRPCEENEFIVGRNRR